jgi:ABC-type oligopeptide transport system substrate-binding subunit
VRFNSYAVGAGWRKRLLAFILAAATVLALSCGGDRARDSRASAKPVVLTRSLAGQPGSLDPHRAEDVFSYDVLRDLYEGLTASKPDGEVIPAAATTWRVENDGTRYVFTLRDDARWSNGDAVVAQEFVDGFRRAVNPATASGAADLLRAIENAPAILARELPPERLGVRALDAHRLEVRLARPLPYFPDILTNTVASPLHHSSSTTEGGFARAGRTVTNGPYTLAEISPGAHLRLVRNPHYWGAATLTFDEVRYEFIADENAEFTRFRAGEIDVTYSVPEQRFQELLAKPDSGLQHRATLATVYLTLNTERGPLARSRALREALTLAIDREAIVGSVVRAGQVPAYSLVPAGVWNYAPADYPWRREPGEQRRSRARRLYASAGFSVERPLRIRLLLNDNELVQRVCLAVAAMWKDVLGVETDLVTLEFKAYLAARADPAQWDAVRVGWTADYNDATTFLGTMTGDSPQNFGRWSNREYATLLAAAARELDPAARREMLQRAEAMMLAHYPVLPLYFYVTRRLVQPRIAAPPINPMNRTYSRDFRLTG